MTTEPRDSSERATASRAPCRRRSRAAVALVALLVLAVLAFGAVRVLGESQARRSGTNSVSPVAAVAKLGPSDRFCQSARVPAGTGAIEAPLADGTAGSGLKLSLADRGGLEYASDVAPRRRVSGWARFELASPPRSDVEGEVCFEGEPATLRGDLAKSGLERNGATVPGAVTLAYFRPGSERLVSIVPEIARRIGRTRGHLGGAWRAPAILVLFAAAVALSAWLFVNLARWRGVRGAALGVAVVSVLNALAWSLLTPPMQIPDEHYHVSYVQDLAESGRPPDGGEDRLSDELNVIVGGAALGDINFNPYGRPRWSADSEVELDAALALDPSPENVGASVNVKDYPPLYYAGMVPVYATTHALGGSTLDAMTLMRATGALFAGVTVLAIFLFLLELFPERRLLAGAVALICAFQPVFSWISGAINPDALLIALGAVLFWLFARGFNRGLTVPLAGALGLVVAAAVLTKVSAIGLVPGWATGMAVLLWRRTRRTERVRAALAGTLAAGVPVVAYAVINTQVWGRSLLPGGVGAAASGPGAAEADGASSFASYLWQYVLPPVGSMTDFFEVGWTPKDFWTPLWVGRFGWFDYQFPDKVNQAAFVLFVMIAVAALVALVPRIGRLGLPVVAFALLAGGLTLAIARAGYPLRATGTMLFEQARYLMPLLALYALALALAASLLPSRFATGALGLALAGASLHLLAAWVLTLQRYYL